MQIEQIRGTDIVVNDTNSGVNSQKKTEKTEQPLRSIEMDTPFYNKSA